MKIRRAYCVEMNDEVTISQARREYLSMKNPPARFTFFCNDFACTVNGHQVAIDGVNYRKPAEDSEKFIVEHFRAKATSPHSPECCWHDDENDILNPIPITENSERRVAKAKKTDFVTIFDPFPRRKIQAYKSGIQAIEGIDDEEDLKRISQSNQHKPGSLRQHGGEVKTSDFELLVQSYREAKATLSTDEFNSLELRIVGQPAPIKYRDLFRHITIADESCIIYGGVKFIRYYSDGFLLRFFDLINEQEVFVYISPQQIRDFKYGRSLRSTVEIMDVENRHATAYIIGCFSDAPKGGINVSINDLSHFSLILAKPRERTISSGTPI